MSVMLRSGFVVVSVILTPVDVVVFGILTSSVVVSVLLTSGVGLL